MKSMYRVFWALLALACFSSSSSASFHGRKILDYPDITSISSSSSARFHGRKILDYPEITCFSSSSSARFHGRKILDFPEITCFSSSSSARFHGRKTLDYPEITCLPSSSSSSAGFHGRKILDYPESVQPSLAPNRPSIDPNLVLILAALLCALFFGLGLNLMIRCALCLTSVLRVPSMAGRGHMTTADHVTSALGPVRANTGLKKAVIDALPLVAYGGAAISGVANECGGADIECVICLKEFVEGERVRVLPKCAHCFHVECIDRWFVSHSLCPICRTRMPESLEKKTAAANAPCSNCGRTNGDESTAPDGSQNVGTQSAPSDLASCSGTGSNVVAEGAVS